MSSNLFLSNSRSQHKISTATTMLLLVTALWYIPGFHNICVYLDTQAFTILNKSLIDRAWWQYFCGMLNHPRENWLNLVVMVAINFVGLALTRDNKTKTLGLIIYYWAIFQLGLLLSHAIFGKTLLDLDRESPSFVIQPWVILPEVLGNPEIKYKSASSFPAGHTFVLVYWYFFTREYVNKFLKVLSFAVAFILLFPRMISGAHWLSDVVFTSFLSYLWYCIALKFKSKIIWFSAK